MSEFSRQLVGVDANTYNAVADAFKQRTPISAGTLGDEIVDRVALVGSAGRIAERILELEAAGVHMIGMRMPGALLGSLDFEANLERIGTEVAPTVKSVIRNQRTRHA